MKIKIQIILILVFTFEIFSQGSVPINSFGPNGGIITAISGSDDEANLVAGVKENGIFYSLTQSDNWIQSNLKNVTVNQFANNTTSKNIFYAATNFGVYVSTDAGKNWTKTGLNKNSTSIFYHKKTNIVVAGIYSVGSDSSGLWYSKNNGQSWLRADTAIKVNKYITSIAMDENDDSTIFVGIDSLGVFSSYDFGRTWFQEIKGLTNLNSKRVQTILHYFDPVLTYNVISIGTANGIYISNNFPGSPIDWTSLKDISGISDNLISDGKLNLISTLNRYYFFSTKQGFDSEIPGEIKGGLYRVSTLNQTMSLVFKSYFDVNSIFIPKLKNNKVYIATSGGVFASSESGLNFQKKSNGIDLSDIKSISITNESDQIIFAGIYGAGVQRSLDGGKNWENANNGLTNPYVFSVLVDSQNIGTLYSATARGLYKSTNYGNTWSFIQIGINDSTKYNLQNSGNIKLGKINSKNIIFSSYAHGINFSSDGGVKFTKPQNEKISQFLNLKIKNNFEFFGKSDSTIIGTANGIWKSFDFGQNWIENSNNFPVNYNDAGVYKKLYAFNPKFHPKNDSIIFLTTTTDTINLTPNKLFKTINGGLIWSELSISPNDFSLDPRKTKIAFAINEKNIYHTLDGGNNWNVLNNSDDKKFSNLISNPQNPNIQFIGSKTGIYQIDYSSDADLDFSDFTVDFSGQLIGSESKRSIILKNIGGVELDFKIDSTLGSEKFVIEKFQVYVPSRSSGQIDIKFYPEKIGEHKIKLYCTTNDPKYENFEIQISGVGVGKVTSNQKILIDSIHFVNAGGGYHETKKYFSNLISVLQSSGYDVVVNQKKFSPFGFSSVVIPPPYYGYSSIEIDSIQKYILNGGFVIMLADSGAKNGNKFLNDILTDYRWKLDFKDSTGIKITSNILIDSVLGSSNKNSLIKIKNENNFAKQYFNNVDTIVVDGAVSILVSDSTKILFTGNSSTRVIENNIISNDSIFPILIAESKIKSGRILVVGDCDIFSNGNQNDTLSSSFNSGILSAKNLQFALNLFSYKSELPVILPKKTPSNQYITFSIPFDMSNFSVQSVLKDLGSLDISRWRLFKWDVNQGKYIAFPNLEFLNFKRGDGYWLITKGEKNLNFGNAVELSATEYYPIKLQPGYNLVGNPFPYKVSWEKSTKSNFIEKKIWNWSSTKFVSDTIYMEPFAAYFIKNNSTETETILINPLKIDSAGFGKRSFETEKFEKREWKIQIKANSIFGSDEENYIGKIEKAKQEWDELETSEPPTAPSNYLSIYFNRENWNKKNSRFSTDFRQISNEDEFWDFNFNSSRTNEEFSLSFNILGNFESEKNIYLIDFQTERIINLRQNGFNYNFKTKKGETDRNFRLIIGTENFTLKNSLGIPITPLDYELKQNYPNPFNSSTKISYVLSHSANVKIYIYNVLGEVVNIIDDGFHKIGKYEVLWNGKNNFNQTVASGVYFYKISTEEFVAQKKMILLK